MKQLKIGNLFDSRKTAHIWYHIALLKNTYACVVFTLPLEYSRSGTIRNRLLENVNAKTVCFQLEMFKFLFLFPMP